jgi:putative CocE/NonD family hydrolase
MKRLLLLLISFAPLLIAAQPVNKADSALFARNYSKKETYITMRDGVRLFTTIYTPRDKSEKHPILMIRTPYSVGPYGKEYSNLSQRHYVDYLKENYIMVQQDVRGRYMSEGEFEDVRPFNPNKKGKETDEASDTYDTIEWLLANVPGNNGRVGVTGISYPGFYTTMAALSGHPALKAVSPQAPVTDWFSGDDFHHNGALMVLDAFGFYSSFGKPRPQPTKVAAGGFDFKGKDSYSFFMEHGTFADIKKLTGDSIRFFKDLLDHPDKDEFWQDRDTRNFVGNIPEFTSSLVVGGLFDAEDCFGAWNLYKSIEKSARNNNKLVMGPWSHGQWSKEPGDHMGYIRWDSKTSEWYRKHVETPYFNYYLKGKGSPDDIAEATIFFTGENQWKQFDQWPPARKSDKKMYLQSADLLYFKKPISFIGYDKYTSDPAHPVPYTEDVHFGRIREYMTNDQRFASRRPDVLTYQTEVLDEDLTLAGPVIADLFVALSTSDADFIVKLIDVFPDDFKYSDPPHPHPPMPGRDMPPYPMGGYQMLVRGEIMRGRYRNSLEKPEAFVPGRITEVKYALPDVAHTFKKGHRLMIQVQSTWFPLADRNPQQFINIYKARKEDFIPCEIKVYHDAEHPSHVVIPVLE